MTIAHKFPSPPSGERARVRGAAENARRKPDGEARCISSDSEFQIARSDFARPLTPALSPEGGEGGVFAHAV